MAEKTLEIILKARDLAGRPIEALKDRIQRTRDAINQTDKSGGIGAAAKSIGDLGKLARAIAIAEQGANVATGVFQAGAAVFRTWKDDAEGAAEAVKATGDALSQIPIAGKAFGAGNFIGQWLFGDQADADAAVKEIEKIEAAMKRAATAAKIRQKEIAFAEGFGKELENRGRTRGLTGSDLDAEQQRIKFETERAKVEQSIETIRRNSVGTNNAAIEAELQGHYQALEALAEDHRATMQAIEDKRHADAKTAEQKRNAETEQNRQTTLRIIEDAQREAWTAEQSTREQAMRFAGDTAGAEALAIKMAWEREAKGISDAKAAALDALPKDATDDQAKAVVDAYAKSYTAAWDQFQLSLGQREQQAQEERRKERDGQQAQDDAVSAAAVRGAGQGFDARVMRFFSAAGGTGTGSSKPRIETLSEQQLNEQKTQSRTLRDLLTAITNSPGLSPAGL